MNGTNGNEPGYPENALVPYPVIVAATMWPPSCAGLFEQQTFPVPPPAADSGPRPRYLIPAT